MSATENPDAVAPVDLEIRVSLVQVDGRPALQYVLDSPNGKVSYYQHKIQAPQTLIASPEAYRTRLVEQLEKLHAGQDFGGGMLLGKEVEKDLAGIGHDLYEELFPIELRTAYRSFRNAVTTLQITSDEPWIPWELIKPYDDSAPGDPIDDDFLCLQFQLTRWLAGESRPADVVRVEQLAVIEAGEAPGAQKLPLASAEHELVVGLADPASGVCDASLASGTHDELLALLERGDTQLLHFAGHAEFLSGQPNESEILLGGRPFRPRHLSGKLRTRLRQDRPLVFFNGCRVTQQGWSLTRLGGWADRWVRRCGCGAFVGPQWSVGDQAACDLARLFYAALKAGKTFGQAGQEARRQLRKTSSGGLTWLAYSIYAHPNGRLVFGKDNAVVRPPTEWSVPERIRVTPTERPCIDVFISYAREDEKLRAAHETHLALLRRQGLVRTWHDRRILPGEDWAGQIDKNLSTAGMVLLLVSPDFIASDYCWDVEMRRALQRHDDGSAQVIPIILRPCDWQDAPFGRLQVLPKDGKPVVMWPVQDEAWLDVSRRVRAAIESDRSIVPEKIRDRIIDHGLFIRKKTQNFVGREWIFGVIRQFIDTNRRGYFLIVGEPGIGKSAILARLVEERGLIHHFNVRGLGLNRTEHFLENVCAQLVARYDLGYSFLPPEATRDSRFLLTLLEKAAEKARASGDKVVILVDALNEADLAAHPEGANPLFLPMLLPDDVFVIATPRPGVVHLRIECEQQPFELRQDDAGNMADVRDFIEINLPGIRRYVESQGLDDTTFVDEQAEKSQGNFMYLHHVVKAMAQGAYQDREPSTLPAGLRAYYDDHWQLIRKQDEKVWFEYKLPVLVALTVVREPVSIEQIQDFSQVGSRPRVRHVLEEWAQFLYAAEVRANDGPPGRRYRIYHASFQDFIKEKEEVADERVSLEEAHGKIANVLWNELYPEG